MRTCLGVRTHLTALAVALATLPVLLGTGKAHALTIVVGDEAIGSTDLPDSYRLNSGAKLTATGAQLLGVDMNPDSTLVLDNSAVSSTTSDGVAVANGGQVIVGNNSTVFGINQGLSLQRSGTNGSSAQVSDSRIEGVRVGVGISAESQLRLDNSEVVGSGAGSTAIRLVGSGQLDASGSRMVGDRHGIQVYADPTLAGGARIDLDGSHVEGVTGSAILVGNPALPPTLVDISLVNGSTLKGGDGVLLDVQGLSTANMRVDASHLVGDVRVEAGSSANLDLHNNASLTGKLDNVTSLAMAGASQWHMTGDSTVGSLSLSDGSVHFGAATDYQRLTLGGLSGNGTFFMDADFVTGQTDFLDITGVAEGDHSVLVGSSGSEPVTANALHLIHAAAGSASFSLLGGPVDIGAFSYELVQRGQDWFLDASGGQASTGTVALMGLHSAMPTVWYGELSSLRSRMGELRLSEGNAGGWMRAYGNKYNVAAAAGAAYQQVQSGFSLGADAPLPFGDGQWLGGVLAGYSRSGLNFERNASGDVDSYYLGAYATWLDADSGYYFDGVAKLNRFDNSADVTLSDGTRTKGAYRATGIGLSAEFGRHIALQDGYFIEPFTQWSTVHVKDKDHKLDNGLKAEGRDVGSLLGKAGATVGRTIQTDGGGTLQPYLRLAYVHEFADGNQVKVNGHRFDNDLSGGRMEAGAGIAATLSDRLQLHVDLDYGKGSKLEQPWGANVGLRYSW